MTQEERDIAEKFRGGLSKKALKSIYDIYNKYNDPKITDCWCSSLTRKLRAAEFYQWYDAQTND